MSDRLIVGTAAGLAFAAFVAGLAPLHAQGEQGLKNETTLKVGIKNKRLTAGWDESYLEKVLTGP